MPGDYFDLVLSLTNPQRLAMVAHLMAWIGSIQDDAGFMLQAAARKMGERLIAGAPSVRHQDRDTWEAAIYLSPARDLISPRELATLKRAWTKLGWDHEWPSGVERDCKTLARTAAARVRALLAPSPVDPPRQGVIKDDSGEAVGVWSRDRIVSVKGLGPKSQTIPEGAPTVRTPTPAPSLVDVPAAPVTVRAHCWDVLTCEFHRTGGPSFCQCGPDTYRPDLRPKTPDYDYTASPLPEGHVPPPRSPSGPFPGSYMNLDAGLDWSQMSNEEILNKLDGVISGLVKITPSPRDYTYSPRPFYEITPLRMQGPRPHDRSLTGHRLEPINLLIADDPINGDPATPEQRAAVKEWWDKTMGSRAPHNRQGQATAQGVRIHEALETMIKEGITVDTDKVAALLSEPAPVRQPTREEVERMSGGPASFPVWDRERGRTPLPPDVVVIQIPPPPKTLDVDQSAALSALYGEAQAEGVTIPELKHLSWNMLEEYATMGDPTSPVTRYAQRALDIRDGK